MAEEKKKPDLKARLHKGTNPGAVPAPATASAEPAVAPPPADIGAPVGYDAPPPPMATGFGGGDDIAVPDFIKQQMAEKAAAEARAVAERAAAQRAAAEHVRLAAIAADPFAASANVGAQEVRLVIDEKAVSDSEVGRKNTGAILVTIGVGVLALVAGYLAGDFKNSRDEAAKTTGAIGEIRRAVDATGSAVTTLKDKIDAAAAAAGIQGEEQQAPAGQPSAPPRATVDEALVTWFAQQSPDPPLGPDAYAGRVGRLRPDLVSKLMRVQVELEQLWRELQRHQALTSGNNLVVVRNSLAEAQRVRTEYQQVAVVFAPGRGENAPPVMGTLVAPTPDPTDPSAFSVLLGGAPPQRRTLYTTGDLAAPTTIGTVLIPVASNAGVIANVVSNLGRPWADYVARLNRLKTQIDALQNDHHSLGEALTRAGVN